MKYILFLFLSLPISLISQTSPASLWCASQCDAAGDEKKNTLAIFNKMSKQLDFRSLTIQDNLEEIEFKLRVVFVLPDRKASSEEKKNVKSMLSTLNEAFEKSNISFKLCKIENVSSPLKVEDLTENGYQPYLEFSEIHDKEDVITIYIFDYNKELCMITPSTISCGRTGGFSYVLSERTNNLVLSLFDLEDKKTIVHEMGHFFGLYHTFEEAQFGKDNFNSDCEMVGDGICDTPPDPSTAFEVYVNYSNCEMMGFIDMKGNEYKPQINNFMTYYKPCYLTKYSFTDGQSKVLRTAALSEYRNKFINN